MITCTRKINFIILIALRNTQRPFKEMLLVNSFKSNLCCATFLAGDIAEMEMI